MHTQTAMQAFFDPAIWTVTCVVWDRASGHAAVIDPVLDYDFKLGHTHSASADRVIAYAQENQLRVDWILETRAHADHLSGARFLQERIGGRIAIGVHICQVQATFNKVFHFERSFLPDGSQFDHLFKDGETSMIGGIEAAALWLPDHTPAGLAYRIGDSVFVDDALFMCDHSGRAACPQHPCAGRHRRGRIRRHARCP